MLVNDVVAGAWHVEGGVGAGQFAVLAHGDHGVEEEPGLLLECHLAKQVLNSLGYRQRGIPVGFVDSIHVHFLSEGSKTVTHSVFKSK